MFDRFNNLVKAIVGVVIETPLAVVADVITMGGVLTDKEVPYTADALEKVYENLKDSTK